MRIERRATPTIIYKQPSPTPQNMFSVGLYFLALCLEASAQTHPAYITAFNQNPAGVLPADTNVVFSCRTVVTSVYWLVAGNRFDASTSTSEFTVTTQMLGDTSTLSNLTTRAKINGNNTQVACIAMDSSSATDTRVSHIVIAAVPLPPFLQLALFSDGSRLRSHWNRPFAMSGFPVTSYTLDVVNKTNGERTKVIFDQNFTEPVIYDVTNLDFQSACHPLSFSVIASNSVGDSSPSNIITSGFPIFPQTDNVTLHVDLDTSSEVPRLIVTFPAPEVCAYQNPATYTIGIFDENGDELILTDHRLANTSTVVEVIEARLERGNLYSAELTIQHANVPGEAFVTFLGIDFSDFTTTKGTAVAMKSTSVTMLMSLTVFINYCYS